MQHKLEVVYENGVLRPLGPLPDQIREHQRFTVTVDTLGPAARPDASGAQGGAPAATLEEVRAILAKAAKSLAEVVNAGREER